MPSLEATTASILLSLCGQELLHVLLGVLRLPAVGIGFADVFDLARVDRLLQDFQLPGEEEIGVRIGGGAFDEDEVAFRLLLEYLARLQAADFLVVEGDVEGVGFSIRRS